MFVDPIVIIPEGGGLLLINAASGDGGRLGPRMDLLQRKVLEKDLHFLGIGGLNVVTENFSFFAAKSTLKIAEHRDLDGSVGESETGNAVCLDLLKVVSKRTTVDFKNIALDQLLAVFGNVE